VKTGGFQMRARAALLILMLSFVTLARADGSLYAPLGGTVRAPIGWIEFCKANPNECRASASQPRDVVLTDTAFKDLEKVNSWVNANVKQKSDTDHWGVLEKWSIPTDGYGDTEDFALLKRKMLIDAGWPAEALLITVVASRSNEGLAVLTVKTDKGEFILSDLSDAVVPWLDVPKTLGFRFDKRQSQNDPNVWVTVGRPPSN